MQVGFFQDLFLRVSFGGGGAGHWGLLLSWVGGLALGFCNNNSSTVMLVP